jgi:sulfite reductase (ferredoxin)
MGLADAEREVFEAQLLLDEGQPENAARRAYEAMLRAARALAHEKNPNVSEEPAEVVSEFRTHFCDTKLFFDPYAGGKFANYLFRAHSEGIGTPNLESAHQLIEEATLFVDAAHQCYTRIGSVMP